MSSKSPQNSIKSNLQEVFFKKPYLKKIVEQWHLSQQLLTNLEFMKKNLITGNNYFRSLQKTIDCFIHSIFYLNLLKINFLNIYFFQIFFRLIASQKDKLTHIPDDYFKTKSIFSS